MIFFYDFSPQFFFQVCQCIRWIFFLCRAPRTLRQTIHPFSTHERLFCHVSCFPLSCPSRIFLQVSFSHCTCNRAKSLRHRKLLFFFFDVQSPGCQTFLDTSQTCNPNLPASLSFSSQSLCWFP